MLVEELKNFNERKAIAEESKRIAIEQLANGKNLTAEELKNLREKGIEYAKQLQQKKAISDEEIEILKKAQIEVKNLTLATSQRLAEIAEDFGKAELNLWLEQNQSKITAGQSFNKEALDLEVERLERIKKENLKFIDNADKYKEDALMQKRKDNIALTLEEMAFLEESLRINREYTEKKTAIEKTFADNKKTDEKKKRDDDAVAKQTELEVKKATAQTEYEEQLIEEEMRYQAEKAKLDERKAEGLISKVQYDALLEAEDKKSAENKKAIEKAVMDNKLSLASSTFGNLAAIMGKESAAGKAMAVAQATIDTYKSAVSAYSSMSGIPIVGPALGAVAAAAAVAAGVANVKKITSTKPPKAEKGALFNIGGNRHSAGGTMFTGTDGTQFEAEKGELIGVMNRNAASHFMAFNNTFPAGGSSTPGYFANGGIVSREIAQQDMNMDELAMKIAEANRVLPAPVVAVQDIISQGNSYVKVRDAANF